MDMYEREQRYQRRIEEERHRQLVDLGQQSLNLEQQRLEEQRIFNQKILEQSITDAAAFKRGSDQVFNDGDILINNEGIIWNLDSFPCSYIENRLIEAYYSGVNSNFRKIFPSIDWSTIFQQVEFIGEDLHNFLAIKSSEILESIKYDSTRHSNETHPEYERVYRILLTSKYDSKKYSIQLVNLKIKIAIKYGLKYQILIADSWKPYEEVSHDSLVSPFFNTRLNDIFLEKFKFNELINNINNEFSETLTAIQKSDVKIEKKWKTSSAAINFAEALEVAVVWGMIGAFMGIFTGLLGGWNVFFITVGVFALCGFFWKLKN